MSDQEPTHHITHTPTGTRAAVRIAPSVEARLRDIDPRLQDGAEKHVAIAFRHTRPHAGGSDMSGRYVNFDDLDIRPIERGDDGEPFVPMDHHGDPIDPDAD